MAINEKGGDLQQSAKLSEYAEVVSGLSIGSGTSSVIEYGYMNIYREFQPYDMSANPPVATGSPRSLVLKTLITPEKMPVSAQDYIRVFADIELDLFTGDDEDYERVQDTMTGTVTFTGANPDTFDMYYRDNSEGVWKSVQLDVPISLTKDASDFLFAPLLSGIPPHLVDIKGYLGNDENHECKIVFTGFECTMKRTYNHNGNMQTEYFNRSPKYTFAGNVATLYSNDTLLPPYAFYNFCKNATINYWYGIVFDVNSTENTVSSEALNPFTDAVLSEGCYAYMFADAYTDTHLCNVLPAENLPDKCYFHMFDGSKDKQGRIELRALTLGDYSCAYMFNNYENLKELKVHFTEWSDDNHATENWVSGVKSSGTFYKPKALPEIFDESHIPVGWTVVNYEDMEETE